MIRKKGWIKVLANAAFSLFQYCFWRRCWHCQEMLPHEMALVHARVLLGEDWQPQQHLKQVGIHLR